MAIYKRTIQSHILHEVISEQYPYLTKDEHELNIDLKALLGS